MNNTEVFNTKGCVVVSNFIDSVSIQTVSKYLEHKFNQNGFAIKTDLKSTISTPSNFYYYSDPLIEVILENSLGEIEVIVGKELYPTYSYVRIYTGDNELPRHTDRPSCEYSVTVNVATVGNPWPIWMQKKDGTPQSFTLSSGDAIIYKGCEMHHWRDSMSASNTDINVQFMLHYVDKNGPNTSYKWDKRSKLGLPKTTRIT